MSEIEFKGSDIPNKDNNTKLSSFNVPKNISQNDNNQLDIEYNNVGNIIKKNTGSKLKSLSEEVDILSLSNKELLDRFIDDKFENSNGISNNDKKEFLLFLTDVLTDTLSGDLNLINIKNIDIDGNQKLSLFELDKIKSKIQTNFIDIKKMGSYSSFLDIYEEIDDDINDLAFKDNIDTWLGGKTITETMVNGVGDISKQEADLLLQSKWGDDNFGKGLAFALVREVPQMAEDILIFLADLPGALLSLPQYSYYKWRDGHGYDMKTRAMEEKHPVLGLIGLLSNGGKVLANLAGELGSPSTWTAGGIVLSITAIIGLVAGGSGAANLASKGGRLGKIGIGIEKADRVVNFSEYAVMDTIGKISIAAPKIHEISKVTIDELLTLDNKGILKIESSDYFRDINPKDLEKVLLERIEKIESTKGINVKTIDISEFNSVEHKYLKEKLYNIIGNNFPLLEVSRLTEGDKVLDITFLGVKALNDNISKEFVDLFNGQLKKYYHNNFNKNTGGEGNYGRIIRDNYKHITFSMNSKKDISETIFGNIKNKRELFEIIFDNLNKNELDIALKEAKIKDLDEVKSTLLKNFDFGIGTTIVQKSSKFGILTPNDKLEAFYKAEIASRNKVDLGNLGNNLEFSFDNIKSFAKNALNKEKEIVSTYVGKKFTFNSTEFDVVVNGKINNILLRYIRKGENIGNDKLSELVNDYIINLNDGFDFIAPFVNKGQLKDVDKIEKQIENGIIDTSYLLDTYKKTLSLHALKVQTNGKEGLRIFIDIVDMGIMNLNDFRKLALKVTSGELRANNMDDLLSAGQTATNRFQNLVTSIKYSYPGSKVSLGGDEIFIFIPGKTELETRGIISDITKKLKKEDLIGRISNSTNKNNERIFDNLDNFTSINKFFEKKVEKIINNNGDVKVKKMGKSDNIKILRDIKSFSSINLNINLSIQEKISKNIPKFIIDLKESIDYNMIRAVLTGRKDRYIFAFKGFTVNVDKNTNNELIISIK